MDATSGLQRFQLLSKDASTQGDLDKVVVLAHGPGGQQHQLEVRPPLKSSGGFMGAVFGPSKEMVHAQQTASIAALAQFRQALVEQYGAQVGAYAGKSLQERALTVKDIGDALATAESAKQNLNLHQPAFLKAFNEQLTTPGQRALAQDGKVNTLILDIFAGSRLLSDSTAATRDMLAQSAAKVVRTLSEMPGASLARAQGILTLAAPTGSPSLATQVVQDMTRPLGADRMSFDGASVMNAQVVPAKAVIAPAVQPAPAAWPDRVNVRGTSTLDTSGAVSGSDTGAQRASGQPATTPRQLRGDIAREVERLPVSKPLETITLAGGTTTTLCRQLLTDSSRGSYTINGKPVSVSYDQEGTPDHNAFGAAFRAGFPAGAKGDAIARLASACMNQYCLNPMMEYVGQNAGFTPIKSGSDTLSYDAWQNQDGSWGIRCAMLRRFEMISDHSNNNDIVDLPGSRTCLCTAEFTLDTSGDTPRLSQVGTDIAFSGKVPAN